MTDAVGLSQFMFSMGEMTRGALTPSIPPVWERHLLTASDSPLITCDHPIYDNAANGTTIKSIDDPVHRSFFFGPTQISAFRRFVPDNFRCSTFDILTACIWHCHTKALEFGPSEDVCLICIVNAWSKINPPLPLGYYGNTVGYPVALTTARSLCKNPIGYAVELVKPAKAKVTAEYMKSKVDLIVIRGRQNLNMVRSFLVSDVTRARFGDLDFGWSEAAYVAPALSWEVMSFYILFKNKKEEEGIVVPDSLPASTMGNFVKELDSILKDELASK